MVYGGTIIADSQDEDIIKVLLMHASLRFGRSKTAQYATCSLLDIQPTEPLKNESVLSTRTLYVILNSDMLLTQDGMTLALAENARSQIAEALGIPNKKPADCDDYVSYHTISGYQAMWQMQKIPYTVIRGGSVFVYDAAGLSVPRESRIGLFPQEGMGHFTVYSSEEMLKKTTIEKRKPDQYQSETTSENNSLSSEAAALKSAIIASAADMLIK